MINMVGDGKDANIRQTAYNFLNSHRLATLSTVGPTGNAHGASVYYVIDEKLTFYFMTRVESRKFYHISVHPRISFVITDEKEMVTVQLTGNAERVDELNYDNEILFRLWVDDFGSPNWPPPAVQLFEKGASAELAVIKITPKEMTYANFQKLKKDRYKSFFKQVLP